MNEADSSDEDVLDPRIQIELEKLNTTTDEINRLEIEFDEANTAFRQLLNESTRRLKLLATKLGSCIERARPYYEAAEVAKKAQQECQLAAVKFQKANAVHSAAKETVALAEQRFLSNQHQWQFDNAWQEMLNHATIKVMEAETQKADSGREHQQKATLFKMADDQVKSLEEKLQRSLSKSRPYFDEKTLCQEQLNTQKERIEALKRSIVKAKCFYSDTLKRLEHISDDIHRQRGLTAAANEELLKRPREPGVGSELAASYEEVHVKKSESSPQDSNEDDAIEESALCGQMSGVELRADGLSVRPIDGGEGKCVEEFCESGGNSS